MTQPAILVVDPNGDQRRILTALLRDRGYRVHEARDAAGALEIVDAQDLDLILGEHPVGPPDGDPLCVTLLADPATAGLPFLALTARAMPDELEAARQSHPAGVLIKPVPLHRLLAKVEGILARHGSMPGQESRTAKSDT